MTNIKLFEEKKVRSHWDAETEVWYFSVIDVVWVLEQPWWALNAAHLFPPLTKGGLGGI